MGTDTNDILLDRQSDLDDAHACIAHRTQAGLEAPGSETAIKCDVSALPLIPFLPTPSACTPCPTHAYCEEGDFLSCDPEYILKPHMLSFLSPAMDGLPGLGPRAFPPSCEPDTARKRLVGGLAKTIEADLAKGRGAVVCAGLGRGNARKGDGEVYGLKEDLIRERYTIRRDVSRSACPYPHPQPKYSLEHFNEIFEAALQDLVEHGDVIESIDADGRSWYAASRADLTLSCRARLELVNLIDAWKGQLGSESCHSEPRSKSAGAAMLLFIYLLRNSVASRRAESTRAKELASVVLKRLQDQEHHHYADPVTTATPYVASTQLRDVVLDSGSAATRNRVWDRVVKLVEGNANIETREREVKGEVWRTWEWTGVGQARLTHQ